MYFIWQWISDKHRLFLSLALTDPDQPRLTVTPAVIRETDSVLLRCETPPHLSVSQCYIAIENQNPLHSCDITYTGTALLTMTGQRSAAEVTMKCYYYTAGHSTPSLLSDPVSVTVLGKTFTTNVDLSCQQRYRDITSVVVWSLKCIYWGHGDMWNTSLCHSSEYKLVFSFEESWDWW